MTSSKLIWKQDSPRYKYNCSEKKTNVNQLKFPKTNNTTILAQLHYWHKLRQKITCRKVIYDKLVCLNKFHFY